MAHLHKRSFCPNCNSPLGVTDLFCSACGQKRLEEKDLSIRRLFRESFLDYFHFDSKFFRTFIPLLFRPGFLTREFMQGRRRQYVQPFKMFLVITVIFFLVQSLLHHDESTDRPLVKPVPATGSIRNGIRSEIIENEKESAELDSVRVRISEIGIDAYVREKNPDQTGLSRYLTKKILKIRLKTGESFSTILTKNASKVVFVLIPVFALLLKILYARRKRLYFEHLIFSLHFHSFFFILLLITVLADMIYDHSTLITVFLSTLYLLLALKNYYRQSLWKSLMKMLLLFISYTIIGLPVFLILLALVSLLMV